MALNARDLFFVLRCQDEATKTLGNVSRDILGVGDAAAAATAKSQAAALRARAEQMKNTGATQDDIDAVLRDAQAYDQQAKSLQKAADQHAKAAQTLKDVGQTMVMVGAGMALVGAGILGSLASTVKYSQEYQRQVALTKTQVDGFSASLSQLSELGKDVANNIAVPFEQVQPTLYNIFSSTNANLKQATTLMNAFAKASVAGQVSIDEASKGTMAILNGLHIPLEDVNQVLDVQFQLVRKGVGTYQQFNSVMGRIIPSANKAGQNIQEVSAMLAFMTRNGLTAAMASTAGARALDAFANPLTAKNLANIGIKVSDIHGNFLPLDQILGQMYDKMKGLSETKRSQLLSQIFSYGTGGNIQAMRFITQVLEPGQYQQFIGFLNDMNNATGQFGMAYNTMSKTTASQTQLLKNRFDVLRESVGEMLTPAVNTLIGYLAKLLGSFNGLDPRIQKFAVYAAAVSGAALIIGGAIIAIIGVIGIIAGAIASLGLGFGDVALIIAGAGAAIVAFGVSAYEALTHSKPFMGLLHDIANSAEFTWGILKQLGDGLADEWNAKVVPAFNNLGNIILNQVIPIIQQFYEEFWDKHKNDLIELKNALLSAGKDGFQFVADTVNNFLIPAIKDLINMYNKHQTGIQQVVDWLETFGKWVAKLAGVGFLSTLITIIGAVIIIFAALVSGISTGIDIVSKISKAISTLIGWLKSASNTVSSFKGAFVIAIAESLTEAGRLVSTMGSLPGRIKSAVGNLGGVLVSAGRSAIRGLISGIEDEMGPLGSALGAVSSFIKSHKGPPEKDAVMLRPAGQLVMRGFMNGIDDMLPYLKSQLGGITQNMMPNLMAGVPSGATAATAARYNTINISVYTQELNPQVHAQQLGTYLAARI